MKIGIITGGGPDNYGAVIQAYALQRYLREQGHDAFLISHDCKVHKTLIGHIKQSVRNALVWIGIWPGAKLEKSKKRKKKEWDKQRSFDTFRKNHIALTSRVYTSLHDIQRHYPEADIYITGSDVVWIVDLLSPNHRINYLDFGIESTKRISYAASFGTSTFPVKDIPLFKKLLSKFTMISVRETNGIEFCKRQGFNALRCVDSTLLLTKEHYISLMSPQKHHEPYAFFYTVNVSSADEIHWAELRNHFADKGLRCVVTTGSGFKPAEELFDGATYDYATIEDWLSNVFYSQIVLTASFHGVAFAVIMHKDFIYLPLTSSNAKGNNRITDFLDSVGLRNRQANTAEEAMDLASQPIDYNDLQNAPLQQLIANSKTFISKAIQP